MASTTPSQLSIHADEMAAQVMVGLFEVQIVVVPELNLSLFTALTVQAESQTRVGEQLVKPRTAAPAELVQEALPP